MKCFSISLISFLVFCFSFTHAQYTDFVWYKSTLSDKKTLSSLIPIIKAQQEKNHLRNQEISMKLNSMLFSIKPTQSNRRMIYLLKRLIDEIYIVQSTDEYDRWNRKITLMMEWWDQVWAYDELSTFALLDNPEQRPAQLRTVYLSSALSAGEIEWLYEKYKNIIDEKAQKDYGLRLFISMYTEFWNYNKSISFDQASSTKFIVIYLVDKITREWVSKYFNSESMWESNLTYESILKKLNQEDRTHLKKIISEILFSNYWDDFIYEKDKGSWLFNLWLRDEWLPAMALSAQLQATYATYSSYASLLVQTKWCWEKLKARDFLKKAQLFALNEKAYEQSNNSLSSIESYCTDFDQIAFDKMKSSVRSRYDQ